MHIRRKLAASTSCFEIPAQNGQFTPYLQIGRTLYENDDLLLSQTLTPDQQTALPGNFVYRPFREKTINMLKHRLLVFLYRVVHQDARCLMLT